jgi:hypothetical protein
MQQTNPILTALALKPAANAANRDRKNREYRQEQLKKIYKERGASNAQIESWKTRSTTERSEIPPWEVTLTPHPPSSPPPAQKMPLTPQPPPYRKVLEERGVTSTGGLNNENPVNFSGGSRKTKRRRSNLKQKSRMVNKKNRSRQKIRN